MIKALNGSEPKIGEGVYIAPNASVIGNVSIGDSCGIWFGAVIRGDSNLIRIGSRTNIQDLSVLHCDEKNALSIGDDVTVGHRAILHGCKVGNRVLVGMGATIMNGAVIGDDTIVGAGALVTEGTVVQPGSLILGVPAKIKRPLSVEEKAAVQKSAIHYAENAALYISSL